MRYTTRTERRHWPKRILIMLLVAIIVVVGATVVVRRTYFEKLKPVSVVSAETKLITIEKGSSVDVIAKKLQEEGLIRSAWAFKLYVSSKEVRNALQAGTYSLAANQSVPQIVSQLTHGKVATDLVTVLPAQRLDQIRA
ncbi:MAG TPA: endolytic transglycosylase MltG, partial [Candidatus Saccharimonadales bacterium]|nr:endolytic transglycosylase MltG [Candidatus Saccharimonadales bacterium]